MTNAEDKDMGHRNVKSIISSDDAKLKEEYEAFVAAQMKEQDS